jgi:hypothetical protein
MPDWATIRDFLDRYGIASVIILGAGGFSGYLILFKAWPFLTKEIWPWITKQLEADKAMRMKEHDDFIKALALQASAYGKVAENQEKVAEALSSLVETIETMNEKGRRR